MYHRREQAAGDDSAAMLAAVGFRYVGDAGCWVHLAQERAITQEIVAEHDTDWLAHWITEE
jgi:hypothetical protein